MKRYSDKAMRRLSDDMDMSEKKVMQLAEPNNTSFSSITKDLEHRKFTLVKFDKKEGNNGYYGIAIIHDSVDDKDYNASIKMLAKEGVLEGLAEDNILEVSEWKQQPYFRYIDYVFNKDTNYGYLDIISGRVDPAPKDGALRVFKPTQFKIIKTDTTATAE